MSDVALEVGGRKYTVACADGQEEHVQRLASVIDGKLGTMGANLSSQEAKNLLFAALLLADELDEAKRGTPSHTAPAEPDFDGGRLAAQLERIASALENAAQVLEGGRQTP
ncbi:MAG: cell division protein ZapA [Erythrobacter sp.]